jgi:hypothetical protein
MARPGPLAMSALAALLGAKRPPPTVGELGHSVGVGGNLTGIAL